MKTLFLSFFCAFFSQAILKNLFIAVSVNTKTSNYLLAKNGVGENSFYTMDDVYYDHTSKNELNNNNTFANGKSNLYYNKTNDDDSSNIKRQENVNMMVDENELNTITSLNKLNNTNAFEKIRSAYYDSNNDNSKENLYEHIKQILSIALNVSPKDINLHDLNMLLKKWKQINKRKMHLSHEEFNDDHNYDNFLKGIKEHKAQRGDSMPNVLGKLVIPKEQLIGADETNNKKAFIDNNYLFELII